MKMKGDITLKILEAAGELAINLFDLPAAIISAGYGASQGKIEYEMGEIKARRAVQNFREKEDRILQRRFSKMLTKLERDGLISKSKAKNRNENIFRLTAKGKGKIEELRARKENYQPVLKYEKEDSPNLIIVSFDIPEAFRRKRNWLRAVLKNLDFSMVQKSVWVGKVKIPRLLLEDLRKYKMIGFVEIFEVSKSGSLNKIA